MECFTVNADVGQRPAIDLSQLGDHLMRSGTLKQIYSYLFSTQNANSFSAKDLLCTRVVLDVDKPGTKWMHPIR
jgi:hypothetical protein